MANPVFVVEDIHTVRRTRVLTLLGVPFMVTRLGWFTPFAPIPLMFIIAPIFYPQSSLLDRFGFAVSWSLLFTGINFLHSLGHIVSGRIAGSAMDELLITGTRHVNIYKGDQSAYPPRIHIMRALGGPLANLLGGVIGLIGIVIAGPNPLLIGWTALNFLFGFGSLAPVESVDGGTIAYYLRRDRHEKVSA